MLQSSSRTIYGEHRRTTGTEHDEFKNYKNNRQNRQKGQNRQILQCFVGARVEPSSVSKILFGFSALGGSRSAG
jgi:hypothetical protein